MTWWRRGGERTPDPRVEETVLIPEEFEPPGDAELEIEEEEEFLEVLVWRMRSGEHSTVVGVTEDLGDGERIWFRVRDDGQGDSLHKSSVVAEVRIGDRARERTSSVTDLYKRRGWRLVDGPRSIEVPLPELNGVDVLAGTPLQSWAYGLATQFRAGEL